MLALCTNYTTQKKILQLKKRRNLPIYALCFLFSPLSPPACTSGPHIKFGRTIAAQLKRHTHVVSGSFQLYEGGAIPETRCCSE
ncbi:hypothetical protein BJX66DRAFT_315755 [Aspergillus keveii]|uniref:Secreted protein n=1 Tax=Aspergillus keveii TaxID=714993 RepID=A0ABR4FNY8_9EURO